jgi:hypothetical protein
MARCCGGRRCPGNAIPAVHKILECRRGIGRGGGQCTGTSDAKCVGTPLPVSVSRQKVQAMPASVLVRQAIGQGSKRVGEPPLFVGPLTRAPSNERPEAFLGDSSTGGLEFPLLARAPSLKSTAAELLRLPRVWCFPDETAGTDKNLSPKIAARLSSHFCEPIILLPPFRLTPSQPPPLSLSFLPRFRQFSASFESRTHTETSQWLPQ